MLLNYFRIAVRSLLQNKLYSIINIGGLAVGLSCFAAIMLFVEVEHSFDQFHDRPESIVRVAKNFVNDDGIVVPDVNTPPALSAAVMDELPEVELATRFVPNRGRLYLVEVGDKRFYETKLIRADKHFFKLFDFSFVRGSRENSFNGIKSVVITESIAAKYFGDADPLNKIIRMNVNNGTDYLVSAVVKDVPENSHFTFDMVVPFVSGRDETLDENWNWHIFLTYVRLTPDADPLEFESNVKALFKRQQPTSTDQYFTQPLTDIHLKSKLNGELLVNGDEFNVRIMAIIGVFIILIATVNYVNLITARSARRAKEIGIRKVSGADKQQLKSQLLLETGITVAISALLAFALLTSLLPLAQPILGYDLYAFMSQSIWIKVWVPASLLVISLLAGIYPAFVLSSFEPIKVLKSGLLTSTDGRLIRQSLVLFQLIISTGLIISSLTIFRQLDFITNKDLGFESENVIMLPNVRGGIGNNNDAASMLESMKSIPGVSHIGRADGVLGDNNSRNGIVASQGNGQHLSVNFCRIDYEFLPALQLKLKEGRNFSELFASDSNAILLNEAAAHELGLKAPYTGQQITWDDGPGKTHDLTVVGVLEDFHFRSLKEEITPFAFILEVGNGSTFFVKLNAHDVERSVEAIGEIWMKHFPERPFIYSFQDETFFRQHQYDRNFQKIFAALTAIAIIITCMGMFALITSLAEAKIKEIGVRKVLGASVTSIIVLLTGNFAVMALIALVVTSPLVYYFMDGWLSQFAYHVDMNWTVFALAGIISLTIAMLTAGMQALKAALSNPVKSLRNE